jgi:hypothetical protein
MEWDPEKLRTHPYNGCDVVPNETKLLIIGTCPPPRFERPSDAGHQLSGDCDFYYGSKDNQLWSKIFATIFTDERPKSPEERREFLRRKSIWMHDILETYTRRVNSPYDTDLCPQDLFDLKNVFLSHSNIDTLLLTGRHAEKWTRQKMINQNIIKQTCWPLKTELSQLYKLKIDLDEHARDLIVCTCPSPVRRNNGRYKRRMEFYQKLFATDRLLTGATGVRKEL